MFPIDWERDAVSNAAALMFRSNRLDRMVWRIRYMDDSPPVNAMRDGRTRTIITITERIRP